MTLNRLPHLLLFALMLLMQSATIVHAVEHLDDEHVELCSAYLSLEKLSAIGLNTTPYLLAVSYGEVADLQQSTVFLSQTYPSYSTRAPPLA